MTENISLILRLFVVNLLWQSGETPQQVAMKRYNPSDKDSIDFCVLLIEKNADLSILNKVLTCFNSLSLCKNVPFSWVMINWPSNHLVINCSDTFPYVSSFWRHWFGYKESLKFQSIKQVHQGCWSSNVCKRMDYAYVLMKKNGPYHGSTTLPCWKSIGFYILVVERINDICLSFYANHFIYID